MKKLHYRGARAVFAKLLKQNNYCKEQFVSDVRFRSGQVSLPALATSGLSSLDPFKTGSVSYCGNKQMKFWTSLGGASEYVDRLGKANRDGRCIKNHTWHVGRQEVHHLALGKISNVRIKESG